jgi:hypothetical protein
VGECCVIISQRVCVVRNSLRCARIGACRFQVGLDRSEYRLCEIWEGVSSKKERTLLCWLQSCRVGTRAVCTV